MRFPFFVIIAIFPISLFGQYKSLVPIKDTTVVHYNHEVPLWRSFIAPTVLFGLSAASWQSDGEVRAIRNRYAHDFRSKLDDHMQYAPGATAFALKLSGVKGRNKLGRSAISWGSSMLIMGGLVNSIKYSAKVMRPDGSTRNSFPSGHTATAFMNATFLHKEYGMVDPLYSILGYSMSTYTGISRSLNNRHWLSDILAGAGIGILSTELGYLIVDSFFKNKGDFFTDFSVVEEIENPSFVAIKLGQAYYIDASYIGNLGIEGAIEGAYFFNKRWGIGGEIGFMHMPFEQESIQDWTEVVEVLDDPYLDMESQGMSTFMLGGYYSKFLGKKWLLQGKVQAGLGIGVGGNIDIVGDQLDNGVPVEVKVPFLKYNVQNTMVAGCGVSFTFMVAPTLGLSIYTDYKYANPKTRMTDSDYYQDLPDEDKFDESDHLPVSALSGGLRLISFF